MTKIMTLGISSGGTVENEDLFVHEKGENVHELCHRV